MIGNWDESSGQSLTDYVDEKNRKIELAQLDQFFREQERLKALEDYVSPETDEQRIARLERELELLYGEPVRPISEVCNGIQTWLRVLSENHPVLTDTNGSEHQIGLAWRNSGFTIPLAAAKSNLLWRLLYARDPLRTKKCPEHNGHWSGLSWSWADEEPECACVFDGQLTGWLPNE